MIPPESLGAPVGELLYVRHEHEQEFDKLHCADLKVTVDLFRRIRTLVLQVGKKMHWDSLDLCDAMQQMNYAIEFLVSAFVMARQRARAEAFVLLRCTIEHGVTSVAIANIPALHKEYRRGRLDVKESLGEAKRRLPLLGRFYGQLSNEVVHPSVRAYGSTTHVDERGVPFQRVAIGPQRNVDPNRDRVTLVAVNFSTMLLHWAIGQAFFEDTPLLGTRRLKGAFEVCDGFPSAALVEKLYSEFDGLVRPAASRHRMRPSRT